MLKEFKEFAMRGNVLDMAVGIIIGAAFGKIITSFVGDILTPPIGLLLGKVEFSSLFLNISGKSYDTLAAAKAAGAATLNYGLFLNAVIDFLIVAFVVFLALFFLALQVLTGFNANNLPSYLVQRTIFAWLALGLEFLAFVALLIDFWLELRGPSKPAPRIDLNW